jgi:CHAT domain-containing protein
MEGARFCPGWRRLVVLASMMAFCVPAPAQLRSEDLTSCGSRVIESSYRENAVRGGQDTEISWRDVPAEPLVILVQEQGIDVSVELEKKTATADSPVRRAGTQVLLVAPADSRRVGLRLRGKELSHVRGTVSSVLFTMPTDEQCGGYLRLIASGDREYAAAEALPADRAQRSSKAAEAYAGAEAIALRAHLPALAGHAQLAISATNYQGRNDWAGSQAAGLRATASLTNAQRPYFEARASGMAAAAMLENGIGTAGRDAYLEARVLLEHAIAVFRAGGHLYDEALQRNNVGLSYLYSSRFADCIRESEQVIPMFRKLGERHRVALTEQNIAMCQWGLGRLRAASEILERAIPELRDSPLPIHYTTALNNGALAHFALGEFDQSIMLHAEGERFASQFAMPRERAQSLYGLGVTYAAIGDLSTAQEYLATSLEIRTVAVDRRGRMSSLRALASLLDARGDFAQANKIDREALAVASSDLARLRIESRLMQRSIVAGDVTPAIRKRIEEVMTGVPGGDRMAVANARYLRGLIGSTDSNIEAAHADLDAAGAAFRELELIDGEYDACLASARLAHRQRDFTRAANSIDCARRLADQMRAQVLNPEMRASVSQLRREAADLEVQIAVDDPRLPERRAMRVLAVMERHRGRLLNDYAAVNQSSEAAAAELRELYDNLATARSLLADTQGRGGSDTARAVELRRQIADLRLKLFGAEDRLRTLGSMPATDYSLTTEALQRLSPGTAVVEYWLGGSRAFAIVLTRQGARFQELGATASIDALVLQLRSALADASSIGAATRRRTLQELSRLVLEPVRLDEGTRRVVFVTDGSLHYVPMAALCVPDNMCAKSLVQEIEVASAPSAVGLLKAAPAPISPTGVLIVADPVYQPSDPRLSSIRLARAAASEVMVDLQISRLRSGASPGTLRRIPGTAREARLVAEKFPARDVELLQGLDATRDKVLSLDLTRYGVIHFAVHGLSDDQLPQLSALALSRFNRAGRPEDGRLWAGDLLQRRFNARLVFLSACDTALGAQFSGEGLIGLNYVLLSRGARNVVSSLWPVEDVTTSELVADVYARMRNGDSVVAALTGAQRAYLAKNNDRDIRNWAAWSATIGSMEVP